MEQASLTENCEAIASFFPSKTALSSCECWRQICGNSRQTAGVTLSLHWLFYMLNKWPPVHCLHLCVLIQQPSTGAALLQLSDEIFHVLNKCGSLKKTNKTKTTPNPQNIFQVMHSIHAWIFSIVGKHGCKACCSLLCAVLRFRFYS